MNCLSSDRHKLLEKLRFALPLQARARSPLIERLRRTISQDAARSNLPVTNVFDAGETLGLVCQLDLLNCARCRLISSSRSIISRSTVDTGLI